MPPVEDETTEESLQEEVPSSSSSSDHHRRLRRSTSGAQKKRKSRGMGCKMMSLIVMLILMVLLELLLLTHPDLSTASITSSSTSSTPHALSHPNWFDPRHWKIDLHPQVVAESHITLVDTDNVNNHVTPTTSSSAVATQHPIQVLLQQAGIDWTTVNTTSPKLPSMTTLNALYGKLSEGPVILGMETCRTYQETVKYEDRYTAVAGMFNTGTNAMQFHLQHNIDNLKYAWQVPWGKHRMEFVKHNHTAPGLAKFVKEHALPVVVIRDPFHWMQSMCKMPYAAHWKRRRKEHCPNLVPDKQDMQAFGKELQAMADNNKNATTDKEDELSFHVKVVFEKTSIMYWKSLVHLWSDWYQYYYHATYPRLMVRFEDMLFHPKAVVQAIAECAGTQLSPNFRLQTGSSKTHGSGTTLLTAIEKTSDAQKRIHQMTNEDLQFAAKHLDKNLIKAFHYSIPEV